MPQALAGHGAGLRAAFDVCAELARGCGSSAWIVGVVLGLAQTAFDQAVPLLVL